MNSSCKESITMSVDAINQLKDIVSQLGKDGNQEKEKEYDKIRKCKMLLLKLKGTSRIIFGTLQNTTTTIDNEMTKSDKVLVDVRRLENEIERIRKITTYYQSFSTPQYDSVIQAAGEVSITEENKDKSTFDRQFDHLDTELNNRKRLQSQLDEQIKSKERCLKSSMQLKHHIQNVVVQKIIKAEEAIKKASDCCLEVVNKEEEDNKSVVSSIETSEIPDTTPMEEEAE